MARMIPSFMDDRTPLGERDVFNRLSTCSPEWVVLHSLDLAPWNRRRRTEIDFVIIVPDLGAMCVEVKSHEDISFDGEKWSPPTIERSPFKQVGDARGTFYRRLKNLAPQFASLPIVQCCIFPRSSFDLLPNISVAQWELMDARAFRRLGNAKAFEADLRARITKSIEIDVTLRPLSRALSADQIDAIITCCLPVQKFRPDARQEIRQRQDDLEQLLRAQQKPILQLVQLNERAVISGGAGTGKTLIGMEIAQREAEKGKRVALLCFNQLVGNWMREKIGARGTAPPSLIVGRAIQVMAEMSEVPIPASPTQYFWENDLPDLLEARLTDPDFSAEARFDYLVVDEAQDLLARPRLWDCLVRFLKGGVARGAFALFGDFENQVLTDREPMLKTLAALEIAANPAKWKLAENCRNYRIVGETAVKLAGLGNEVYSDYMRSGSSVANYDVRFYGNDAQQSEEIVGFLSEFAAKGYKPAEITILSLRADSQSAAARISDEKFALRPVRHGFNGTGYASVHAFKGMENKVIILTDVDLADYAFERSLFYTGMTRATESVRVLCNNQSKAILLNWISGA
jgi:hypothetical protein